MAGILLLVMIVLVIIVAIGAMIYDSENPDSTFSYSEETKKFANEIVNRYNDGAEIAFSTESQDPVTEFTYVEKTTQIINEEGNIENVTTLEKVEKTTFSSFDEDTNTKICNIGYPCMIEGRIKLVTELGDDVDPPYGYFLTITCSFRDECDLGQQITINEKTDVLGGIRYMWSTSFKDSLGEHQAQIWVRSAYKDTDKDAYAEYTQTLKIKLIE